MYIMSPATKPFHHYRTPPVWDSASGAPVATLSRQKEDDKGCLATRNKPKGDCQQNNEEPPPPPPLGTQSISRDVHQFHMTSTCSRHVFSGQDTPQPKRDYGMLAGTQKAHQISAHVRHKLLHSLGRA